MRKRAFVVADVLSTTQNQQQKSFAYYTTICSVQDLQGNLERAHSSDIEFIVRA